ncbi:MAG: hypothetical protein ACREB3_09150, partial [Burkholderiales bacterium]
MTPVRLLALSLLMLVATGCAARAETREKNEPPVHTFEIRSGDATINVICNGDTGALEMAVLRDWITESASAVSVYYGRFPVKRLRIVVDALEGRGAQSGTTYAYNGALIRVGVGRFTGHADLKRDWIMTHEMVHLGFPQLAESHAWMEEGLATYVEPIARAQAGQLSEEKVWRDMVEGLPQGLPAAGDRGLDHTHTWGRTYWGGALFFLLADLRIREQTANRVGLQDALRTILNRGGNNEANWEVRRTFEIGDAATGTKVLAELYNEMRAAPVSPDLAELWQRLGVHMQV